MPCHAMPCHVMPRQATPCHATPRHATQRNEPHRTAPHRTTSLHAYAHVRTHECMQPCMHAAMWPHRWFLDMNVGCFGFRCTRLWCRCRSMPTPAHPIPPTPIHHVHTHKQICACAHAHSHTGTYARMHAHTHAQSYRTDAETETDRPRQTQHLLPPVCMVGLALMYIALLPQEVMYSDPLHANGLTWRLKVPDKPWRCAACACTSPSFCPPWCRVRMLTCAVYSGLWDSVGGISVRVAHGRRVRGNHCVCVCACVRVCTFLCGCNPSCHAACLRAACICVRHAHAYTVHMHETVHMHALWHIHEPCNPASYCTCVHCRCNDSRATAENCINKRTHTFIHEVTCS